MTSYDQTAVYPTRHWAPLALQADYISQIALNCLADVNEVAGKQANYQPELALADVAVANGKQADGISQKLRPLTG